MRQKKITWVAIGDSSAVAGVRAEGDVAGLSPTILRTGFWVVGVAIAALSTAQHATMANSGLEIFPPLFVVFAEGPVAPVCITITGTNPLLEFHLIPERMKILIPLTQLILHIMVCTPLIRDTP